MEGIGVEWRTGGGMGVMMRIENRKEKKGKKRKKNNHSDVKTPQLPCGSSKASNGSNKPPKFQLKSP